MKKIQNNVGNRQRVQIVLFLVAIFVALVSYVPALASAPRSRSDSNSLFFIQVFDKDKFVETLTLADLEIYSGNQPLPIDGLVLVKGLKLKKSEGQNIPAPVLPRVLILEFKGYEFHQRLGQVVEHLFRRPYSPSDTISLVTPVNIYGFYSESLRDRTPEELINAGLTILKRDLSVTGKTENEIIQEMTRLVLDLQQGSSAREILMQYQQNLESLKSLRKFNPDPIIVAAGRFSEVRAIKHYIMVYQQEYLPIPNRDMMDRLLADRSIMFQASELFRSIASDETITVAPTIDELMRAGMVLNFIYFKINPRPRPDIQLRELSSDMFDIYSKLAYATGGLVESSATPSAQLKRILESTENYYLVSCPLPQDSDTLGQPGKEIKVFIKDRNYKISLVRL